MAAAKPKQKPGIAQYFFYVMLIMVFLFFFFCGELFLPKESDAYLSECRTLDVVWYEVKADNCVR